MFRALSKTPDTRGIRFTIGVSALKAPHVLALRVVTAAVCVVFTLVIVALKVFREACGMTGS